MVTAQTGYRTWTSEAARLGVAVSVDEPMARHTTYRIGGPADLYAVCGDTQRLHSLWALAHAHRIPVTILGGGSNVLVGDRGIRGLVIGNACRDQQQAGDLVIAESGAQLAGLARWTMRKGLSGLEWGVSVPGTVGGAVIGNAGAHGSDIAANLAWALIAPEGQAPVRVNAAELMFAYRTSALKQALAQGMVAPLVLQAAFSLQPGDPAQMTATANTYLERRRSTQPVEPSAGSVFRNPPRDYAGRLIEACGLKGQQVGGAQISLRHANFIINTGTASATDVRALIDLAQSRVKDSFGIDLMPEILYVGEF